MGETSPDKEGKPGFEIRRAFEVSLEGPSPEFPRRALAHPAGIRGGIRALVSPGMRCAVVLELALPALCVSQQLLAKASMGASCPEAGPPVRAGAPGLRSADSLGGESLLLQQPRSFGFRSHTAVEGCVYEEAQT